MGQSKIEVTEYCCERCDYKWIARHNGEDKGEPNTCPRCKTWLWNKPRYSDMLNFHLRQWFHYGRDWFPNEYKEELLDYIQDMKGHKHYEHALKRYKEQYPS